MGFDLYLATPEECEQTLVNDELTPNILASGSLDGATYTFTDKLGSAGNYYLLEELEINGETSFYGPAIELAE